MVDSHVYWWPQYHGGVSMKPNGSIVQLGKNCNQCNSTKSSRTPSIVWKLTNHEEYTSLLSALPGTVHALYHLRRGETHLTRPGAPTKMQILTWLEIADQNWLWTADKLITSGWLNQRVCPLCRAQDETTLDIFAHCRYSLREWGKKFTSGWQQTCRVGNWIKLHWKHFVSSPHVETKWNYTRNNRFHNTMQHLNIYAYKTIELN